MQMSQSSSSENRLAVVIGASGGVGGALLDELRRESLYAQVIGLSRHSTPALDLLSEPSIIECARYVAAIGTPLLLIDATGFLHDENVEPEKSWRQLSAEHMAKAFAVNAIGPALLMKHFLPLMPRRDHAVFATLSAKVGSIGDNHLGGWYSYRASKAALNQLVRTAAIELRRTAPNGICVALHPGTVDTRLSAPFSKSGLELQTPTLAARRLLDVVSKLEPSQNGQFLDYRGHNLPW
jgi:NAD(P)-dependent dehydrogenase (short-subunit alcohol dehydrogenase family)